MQEWEHNSRILLERSVAVALEQFGDALSDITKDMVAAREALDAAELALARWDNHVVQVIPAPSGMVAVFEREDGLEEYITISYLALHRSGRVLPYMLFGNCESKTPSDYPNFLRIDQASSMSDEVPLEFIGTELAELKPEREKTAWRPL